MQNSGHSAGQTTDQQAVQAGRDPALKEKARLGILVSMWRFVRPYRAQMAAATVALVVTATATLSIGQGLKLLVDRGFGGDGIAALNQSLLVVGAMVVMLAVGTYVRFFLVSWIGERVSADLRRAVFDHLVDLHPGYFEANLSGEIQSRITTDTTLLQTVVGSSVSLALRNLLIMIGGIIWLFVTDIKLTLIVMVSVPLVVAPILIFGRRVRVLSRTSQDKVAEVGTFVGESIKNIKVVQAFNHQRLDSTQFGAHVEDAFAVSVQRIRQRAWLTALVMLLVMGAVLVMIGIGGHDVIAGRITSGELAAFVFYAVMVAGSLGAISEVYGDLQRAAGASERLLELLAVRSPIAVVAQPLPLQEPVRGDVRLDAVRFSYPSRPDTAAIDDLTLHIPAGRTTALVGASGAGKSTLLDLLLRFYDVQKGAILFDGIDIRQLDPQQLREHIALVPQQPVLFSGTVLDNIRYGAPNASEAEVLAAAEAAYAHGFIEKLPQGYQSFVGEGGVRLSGGQRQRIAIARALLRDPALLLLDEATSALDAESEFQVQRALERLMQGRTTLVIAHRLATVVKADNIVVLENGRVVAQGQHQRLLTDSDLYARWASLQFDSSPLKESDVAIATTGGLH